jgi:hypothetical protein
VHHVSTNSGVDRGTIGLAQLDRHKDGEWVLLRDRRSASTR